MMNCRSALFIAFLFMGSGMGCAHFPADRHEESSPEAFLRTSLQKAEEYESRDEWVEALREYEIALTLSPENRTALEGRGRAKDRLKTLAEERYLLGQKLQQEGRFSEARRLFLATLRLDPDHGGALETLASKKRLPTHQEYVVHTLQPGETLSKIAAMYYGDPAKFHLIARFNQIQDARLVRVGQEIKVPSLDGRMTETPDQKGLEPNEKEIPRGYWHWSSVEAEQTERRMPAEMAKAEEGYQIAGYRELGAELLREGRRQEALFELIKVLSVYPDDEEAANYACDASFELGMLKFQAKDYLAAREYFAASLRYRKDCRQSHALLKESEELFKELHYKKGIEHYGKEQLGEAIKAWERVQSLDPKYKRVDTYIEKAKEIQEKLEALRLETQQSLSD
jgi:tetratricopeptide (TPR) repeat protein